MNVTETPCARTYPHDRHGSGPLDPVPPWTCPGVPHPPCTHKFLMCAKCGDIPPSPPPEETPTRTEQDPIIVMSVVADRDGRTVKVFRDPERAVRFAESIDGSVVQCVVGDHDKEWP